ncbi:hypothetical protein Q7C36_013450 [Tachysurus vachellii]|uniref:Uncharacterized protein n=1 Tax=Tachysurus vachellii TaxID=175792 RepID=A0AA88SJD8_TACVA|nr:hypothetical protein Q7C36_013450 [Tachysurus vachellii]
MHVVQKNNCCSFKNTALIGFTVVGDASRRREAGTKGLLSCCSGKVAQGAGAEHLKASSCSSDYVHLHMACQAVSDAVRTAGVQISSVFCCLSFVPISAGLEYYGLNMKGNRLCHVTI